MSVASSYWVTVTTESAAHDAYAETASILFQGLSDLLSNGDTITHLVGPATACHSEMHVSRTDQAQVQARILVDLLGERRLDINKPKLTKLVRGLLPFAVKVQKQRVAADEPA